MNRDVILGICVAGVIFLIFIGYGRRCSAVEYSPSEVSGVVNAR